MRRWVAFLRRDAREGRTHAGAWLVGASGMLLVALTFYFLGELVDQDIEGSATNLGQSYFSFAVSGFAIAALLSDVTRGHCRALRQAQVTGTLEPMLMTPVAPWQIAIGGSLRDTLRGFVRLVAYLLLASAPGGLAVGPHLLWLPIVLLVSALSFLPFGLLAASYTVWLKRGDPVSYIVNAAALLLAGIYFPPTLLPAWLQRLSAVFPVSHAVNALRAVMLQPESPLPSLVWLGAFTAGALPLSAWLFERTVARARRLGDLGQM